MDEKFLLHVNSDWLCAYVVQGFCTLVQREWLDFGHKFADRCGHYGGCGDASERCPVFLLWLDCVHQLLIQFPTAFHFNMTFLVCISFYAMNQSDVA